MRKNLMQEYGKYTIEVMEVVNFIKSGRILKTKFNPELFDDFEVEVIDTLTFDDAYMYFDPDYPGAKIERYIWSDIVKGCGVDYSERDEEDFDDVIRPEIHDLSNELFDYIDEQLIGRLDHEFNDSIKDYFYTLIYDRASAGIVERSMYEKLFKVFQASGYPVGWSGEFPDGKLVVYSK